MRSLKSCSIKILLKLVLFLFLFLGFFFRGYSQDHGKNFSVLLRAEVKSSPSSITLRWHTKNNADQWVIYRKLKSEDKWGSSPLATLGARDTVYNDTAVEKKVSYEYLVAGRQSGNTTSVGYINAGIQLPPVHYRGRILLLVDSNVALNLKKETARLIADINGDGWVVTRHLVGKDESVKNIKAYIKSRYDQYPNTLVGVFLLGDVPVPYSGELNPDGHSNHKGAWPADCFYGEFEGDWTDLFVSNTSAKWERNHNKPNDGKYDPSSQMGVNSPVDLQVGRVDLAGLPVFPESELELTRRYLAKDHAFRHNQVNVKYQAVVEDNFNFAGEGFSQNGWRNFSVLVSSENIKGDDYYSSLKNDHYIWSYGAGGGTFSSAGGIARSGDFAQDSVQGVFTMLFGSYFGDWDSKNNFLRAPLASKGPVLTNCWAGRPVWHVHHMALGENIGYSTRLTQNNYGGGALYNPGFGGGGVHVALMGDPTLRMHYFSPPDGLVAKSIKNGDDVELSWTASPDPQVLGYYVYRYDSLKERYVLVKDQMLKGTSITDLTPFHRIQPYMVRAVKLQSTPSGTYYNLSQGVFDTATGLQPQFPAGKALLTHRSSELSWELYPNPAHETVTLNVRKNNTAGDLEWSIADLNGKLIRKGKLNVSPGEHYKSILLDGLQSGVYLVYLRSPSVRQVKKLVIGGRP